jgi:hypothetical protein
MGPGESTTGIYAKRDILLNEELFTGYGKPQWIYTLMFFSHILSPRTIRDATVRYTILPTDHLAPCLANLASPPSSQLQIKQSAVANERQNVIVDLTGS